MRSGTQARHHIELIAAAPAKPLLGQPCNGCGVCCAAETCPLGRLIFLRRSGPCPALCWVVAEARYHCGLASTPYHYLPWLPVTWSAWVERLMLRMIAAGQGCDADITVDDARQPTTTCSATRNGTGDATDSARGNTAGSSANISTGDANVPSETLRSRR